MHSVIILLKSNFLEPQIHFLLNWFVNCSLDCTEYLLKSYGQGELEHRTSKSRYARTSRKTFLPQVASIERRQARIRHIRAQREARKRDDPTLGTPDQHHFIGKSQNFPEDISIFVQKNLDDPAAKVSLSTSIRVLHISY